VGEIALHMQLDFTLSTDQHQLKQIHDLNHHVDSVVYTTAKICISYPGDFYLIPQRPQIEDLAAIVYMAAFDGHREIFLLGYNKDTPAGRSTWIEDIAKIFRAYPVNFYLVGEPTYMPESWLDCANVRAINYLDWISYCDI
jgi:hypothetical protein